MEVKPKHKEIRRREIESVIFALCAVILAAALLSFNYGDLDKLRAGRDVANYVGPFGAWLAGHLRGILGLSAFFIPLGFGIAAWTMFRQLELKSFGEKLVAIGYLTVVTSPLFSFLINSQIQHHSGGWVGELLWRFLTHVFGLFGGIIVLVSFNIVGLILLGIFSFESLCDGFKHARTFFDRVFKYLNYWFVRIKKRQAPLNKLERVINKRQKLPWIVKKKMVYYTHEAETFNPVNNAPFKLIPLQNPIYDGKGNCTYAIHDYREAESSIFNSVQLQRKDEANENRIPLIAQMLEGDRLTIEVPVRDAVFANSLKEEFVLEKTPSTYESHAGKNENFELINSSQQEENKVDFDEKDEDFDDESTNDVVVMKKNDTDEDIQEIDKQSLPYVFNEIVMEKEYGFPAKYLVSSQSIDSETFQNEIRRNSELLVNTLREFGIESRVIKVNRGPVITLYEMQIAPGIKVNRIVSLADDIAMALAASRVRVVAPIPGKSAVGIEVPNLNREMVTLGDIIKLPEYALIPGKLKVALGKDILGNPVTLDIKKLPHLLIAGATGSGKSVLVNSIITSLIYSYDPNHVRFILVDPKMVELQLYNGLPHLLTPVITEPHVVPRALKWATIEMERRYRLLSAMNTRDIDRYNERAEKLSGYEKLPYIVIIMDELADLMMVAAKEIEGFITRIAQKARAVGIHLVLATQRPSVDVITGIIKANFPARIAFQVAQKTDSRTIIDQNGAEKLLGKGDMLYQSPMSSFPIRIQGAYISEDEIITIVQHLRKLAKPQYIDIEEELFDAEVDDDFADEEDELFQEAVRIVAETKKASASYLQRRLSIGYNRAARMIELMEEKGYIGPQQGSKPREVYL